MRCSPGRPASLTLTRSPAFLGHHYFQPSDDPPFYFMLAEKLAQTGSMFEPFAVRRVSLFGAQVYLHASFISVASIYYLHAVDAGLAMVMSLGLVVGEASRSRLKAWHAVPLGLAMLLLFSLEDVRVNTNSEVTGLAAVLTLYRTVRVPFGPGPDGPKWPMEPRRIALLAAITLVAILLRISNAPAVLLFMGFVFASDYLVAKREPWKPDSLRELLRATAIFAGTFVFALLPWAILQKQSSGTFFYPFGHSNVTPGWTFLESPKDWSEEGSQLITHLFYGKPIVLFLPIAVAELAPLEGRARNDLAALAVASLLGLVVFAHQAAALGPQNTSRYCFGFVAGTSLLAAVSVGRSGARAAIVAMGVAMHLASTHEDTRATLDGYVARAYAALHESGKERQDFDGLTADYVDVQSHVPAGATMATAVFEGFRFDFKRNPIYALDVLGGMGPRPGWRRRPQGTGGARRVPAGQRDPVPGLGRLEPAERVLQPRPLDGPPREDRQPPARRSGAPARRGGLDREDHGDAPRGLSRERHDRRGPRRPACDRRRDLTLSRAVGKSPIGRGTARTPKTPESGRSRGKETTRQDRRGHRVDLTRGLLQSPGVSGVSGVLAVILSAAEVLEAAAHGLGLGEQLLAGGLRGVRVVRDAREAERRPDERGTALHDLLARAHGGVVPRVEQRALHGAVILRAGVDHCRIALADGVGAVALRAARAHRPVARNDVAYGAVAVGGRDGSRRVALLLDDRFAVVHRPAGRRFVGAVGAPVVGRIAGAGVVLHAERASEGSASPVPADSRARRGESDPQHDAERRARSRARAARCVRLRHHRASTLDRLRAATQASERRFRAQFIEGINFLQMRPPRGSILIDSGRGLQAAGRMMRPLAIRA